MKTKLEIMYGIQSKFAEKEGIPNPPYEQFCETVKKLDEDRQDIFDYSSACMDEYSKEVAMDYAHWLLRRMFPYNVQGFRPNPEAEQLFELYQQERNSNT